MYNLLEEKTKLIFCFFIKQFLIFTYLIIGVEYDY